MKREKLNTLNEKDLIVGLITSDKFCREIAPIIKPRQLQIDYVRIIANWIVDFYKNFKKAPKKDILKIYRSHCSEISDEALQDNVLSFLEKLDKTYEELDFNEDYFLEQAIKYLKGRELKNLNDDIDAYLVSGEIEKAENAITKFKAVEKNSGTAVSLLHNAEAIINSFTNEENVLFEFPGAYGKVIGKVHREDFISYLAPMKRGKCLAKGTKILMANGTIKEVQNLVPGDKLMGPDSLPRNVEVVSTGYGKMYHITSKVNSLRRDKNPEIDFTCNGDHILVLKNVWNNEKKQISEFRKDGHRNGEFKKNGKNNILKNEELEISVDDFLKLSDYQKNHFKLFRTKVNYPEKKHIVTPYLFGLWLGDGTGRCSDITTIDKEIIDYCSNWAEENGDNINIPNCKVKTISFNNGYKKQGIFSKELHRLNVINNKHIPNEYLLDSEENRLQLLAGIIDTDGYASKDGNCYDISLMNKELIYDIKKLCQQLGFRTSIKQSYSYYEGMYPETNGYAYCWHLKITGKLSTIPVLLERKKMSDNKKYCSLNNTYSFNIEYVGEDNYYGFVLDGDHRFLLADTTVSHNTWTLMDACITGMQAGLKTVFVTLEMSEQGMLKRFWTATTGQVSEDKDEIDFPYFVFNEDVSKFDIHYKSISRKAVSIADIEKKQKSMRRLSRGGDIRVISVPAYSLSVEKLDIMLEKLVQEENYVPDLIAVDYADIMAPSEKGEYRNQLDGIWKRLRGLAQKWKAVVFTASQSGRASIGKNVDAQDIAEDIRKLAHVTSMVSLNQTDEEKENGILRLKQLAIREDNPEFRQAVCTQCLSIGRIVMDSHFEDEVTEYANNEKKENSKRRK